MGLTPEYLFRPILDTRVSPGHRLVDWIVLQWPGQEWTLVVAISALCLAGATYLVAVLARELSSSPALGLTAAVLFGTWVGWVRIGLWWPTGAHTLPATALMLLSLWLVVRWSRTRRPIDLVLITGTAVLALSFSSRAALIPALAAVILFIGLPPTRSADLGGILARVKKTWPPVILTLAAAILLAYLESRTAGFKNRPTPAIADWLDLARFWMLDSQGAFALNKVPLPSQDHLAVTVPGLAIIGGVVAGTVRGTRSALLWASIAVLIGVCGLQVGWARLGQFGVDVVAFDTRYHEGDIVVLAVLIPCAWAAAGYPRPRTRGQFVAVSVLCVLAIGLWTANWITGVRKIRSDNPPGVNPGAITKATFESIKRTLPNAVDGAKSPTLVNISIPLGLSRVNGADLNEVLRIFLPNYQLGRWSPRGTPIVINDQGLAKKVVPQSRTNVVPGAKPHCLKTRPGSQWLSEGSAGTVFQLPPSKPGQSRVLVVSFSDTKSMGRVALSFQPSANLGLPELEVGVDPKTPGLRVLVPPTASAVALSAWGGISTCVSDVRILQFAS